MEETRHEQVWIILGSRPFKTWRRAYRSPISFQGARRRLQRAGYRVDWYCDTPTCRVYTAGRYVGEE